MIEVGTEDLILKKNWSLDLGILSYLLNGYTEKARHLPTVKKSLTFGKRLDN